MNINDYSSKIKKIYIELHDFSFFHGPSDIEQADKHFIGRKRIIDRLTNLLKNSTTKSGAYLVTGYRGMGKSSYVSQVIDEISTVQKPLTNVKIFISQLIIIFVISQIELYRAGLISFLSILILIIIYIFRYRSLKKSNIYLGRDRYLIALLKYIFILDFKSKSSGKRHKVIIKYVFQLSFIYSIFNLLNSLLSDKVIITFLGITLTSLLFNTIYNLKLVLRNSKIKLEFLKDYLIFKIKNYLNYSHHIYVKINLGQEDLKEIDIFKLLARNIKNHYEKSRLIVRRNFIPRFIIYFMTVLFIYGVSTDVTIKHLNSRIKDKLGFFKVFPSQNTMVQNSKDIKTLSNIIDSLDSKHKFSRENLVILLNDWRTTNSINYRLKDLIEIKPEVEFKEKSIESYNQFFELKFIHNLLNEIAFNIDIAIYTFTTKYFFFILDYLFIFCIILAYCLIHFITRFKYFGVTNRNINKKLSNLEEIIYYQQTHDKNSSMGDKSILGKYYGKSKTRQVADIHEIENCLLEILEQISCAPWWNFQAEFVFIFDELDKLEPFLRSSEENNEVNPTSKQNVLYMPEVSRRRVDMLFKLFSNLKYFLSTAKAKFIFIAGREMYDAALADISDRDYFIKSIFQDVIYVESFLSDPSDKKPSDITSMVEWYVCQYLIPHYLKGDEPLSLKDYNKYLSKYIVEEQWKKDNKEELILRQKREKIIHFLNNFITYLTHVSNGAPNRLKNAFDQYVTEIIDIKELKAEHVYTSGTIKKGLYLKFDYFDQYKVNMFHYLVTPFHFSISNLVKDYGDKTLINATFLINRLFKFHSQGISWRYIELTPELVDINKTQDLRDFISRIMNYLNQTHIQEIVNGLYIYKFPKRISQELSFLSKVSEEASSAFNFTLDETLAIKQIYYKHLFILRERYKQYSDEKGSKYVHTIAAIHAILGDLHFMSDELNQSITEYKESIQYLRNMNSEFMTPDFTILLVRNTLKLGLAFEKRKTYDTALLTYGKLTSFLIERRDIDIMDFGLEKRIIKNPDKKQSEVVLTPIRKERETKNELIDYFDKYQNEIELPEFDEKRDQLKLTSDEFLEKLSENLTIKKAKELFKITSFEDIKLVYQPILAKFQMIEKSSPAGITYSDIKRLISEFEFLIKTIRHREKYLIICDFWNKVADILYYKNGIQYHPLYLNTNKEKFNCLIDHITFDFSQILPFGESCKTRIFNECMKVYEKDTNLIIEKCNRLCKESQKCQKYSSSIKSDHKKNLELLKRNYFPCTACSFYFRSLGILISEFLKDCISEVNEIQEKFITIVVRSMQTKKFQTQRSDYYKTLASILSNIGDVFVSCSDENDIISDIFFQKLLSFMKDNSVGLEVDFNKLNKLEEVLLFYYVSAKFYKKANEFKENSYQLNKLVQILKNYILNNKKTTNNRKDRVNFIKKYLPLIKDIIVRKAIENMYAAYDFIHATEIAKVKNIFAIDEKGDNKEISLCNVSINTEIEEINMQYLGLCLLCNDEMNEIKEYFKYFKENVISPYILNDNMYNRVLQLEFKVHLNYKIFKHVTGYKEYYEFDHNWQMINFFFRSLFNTNDYGQELNKSEINNFIQDLDLNDNYLKEQNIFSDKFNSEKIKANTKFIEDSNAIKGEFSVELQKAQTITDLIKSKSIEIKTIKDKVNDLSHFNNLGIIEIIEELNKMTELLKKFNISILSKDELKKSSYCSDFKEYWKLKVLSQDISNSKNYKNRKFLNQFKRLNRIEDLEKRIDFEFNELQFLIDKYYSEVKNNLNNALNIRKIKFDEDEKLLNEKHNLYVKHKFKKLKFVEFLITDSMFCLQSILRHTNVFDYSFGINYSSSADYRKKMMEWANIYHYFINTCEIINNFQLDKPHEYIKEQSKLIVKPIIHRFNNYVKLMSKRQNIDLLDNIPPNNLEHLKENGEMKFLGILLDVFNVLDLEDKDKIFNKIEELNSSASDFFRNDPRMIITVNRISEKIRAIVFDFVEENNKGKEEYEIDNYKDNCFIILSDELKDYINDKLYRRLKSTFKFNSNIKLILKNLIGEEFLHYSTVSYHAGKARRDYYSAIETHSEGKAYKNFIQKMFYLNDDYNDKFFHFASANERYKINSGKIDDEIKILNYRMSSSSLFNPDNYIKTIIDKDFNN